MKVHLTPEELIVVLSVLERTFVQDKDDKRLVLSVRNRLRGIVKDAVHERHREESFELWQDRVNAILCDFSVTGSLRHPSVDLTTDHNNLADSARRTESPIMTEDDSEFPFDPASEQRKYPRVPSRRRMKGKCQKQ